MDQNVSESLSQQPKQMMQQQPVAPQQSSPSGKILLIVLSVVVLVGVAGVSYYLGSKTTTTNTVPSQTVVTPTNTQSLLQNVSVIPTASAWKTYNPAKGGYSINIPTEGWDVRVYPVNAFVANTPVNADTVEAFPPGELGLPSNSFIIKPLEYRDGNGNIYKTITSLQEIASSAEGKSVSYFVSRTSTPTVIDGHQAVVKEAVWKATPPAGFTGEWHNRTEKEWDIDMGNGKFLSMSYVLDNTDPKDKSLFEQIASTLQINK